MILATIFILSLSSLAFEVLLTRIFSITQWNHLSFMVISIALFGFASSGTFLNILGSRLKNWEKIFSGNHALMLLLISYSATTLIPLPLINLMPLDYFRITLEPIQLLYLLILYLALSLPFFISGIVMSVAYALLPEKTGLIYFSSMTGSAAGVLVPLFLLPFSGEAMLTVSMALCPLALIPFLAIKPEKGRPPPFFMKKGVLLPLVFTAILLAAFFPRSWLPGTLFSVDPGQYKALSTMATFPNTHTDQTLHSLHGKTDLVSSPHLRHAPGLSLTYRKNLPPQQAAYTDGDSPVTFYETENLEKTDFARSTLAWAGYIAVPRPEKILVTLNGGGLGIACALETEAGLVKILAENPQIARLAQAHYNKYPGNNHFTTRKKGPCPHDSVRSHDNGNRFPGLIDVTPKAARMFLEESKSEFDVIHIDNPGASAAGVSALDQDYGFTKEAFQAYHNHLSEKGAIIISRSLLLPPSGSLRLWATAYESLKSMGRKNPEKHLAMMRNWSRFVLVITRFPLKNPEKIEQFASDMNFDIVFLDGFAPEKANRFNVFKEAYYFNEVNRLLAAYKKGSETLFMANYPLDISPQDDNRPFPSKHLKWFRFRELYGITGKRPYSLLLSGEIVVPAVFCEALLISILLVFLPFHGGTQKTDRLNLRAISYFFWTGAGFMFTELYFIKKYVILFGNPVISFAAVLFAILIASGTGGYLSKYVQEKQIKQMLILLISTLFIILAAGTPIVHHMMKLAPGPRWVAGSLFILAPALLTGFPFTTGMHRFPQNPGQRAWAWAANGSASVLASVISAHIALNNGIDAIVMWAVISYTLALLSILKPINLSGRS